MSTIIVNSDTSIVITSNEVSNILTGTSESSSVVTSGEIGPQGLSAYQVAVQNGFVGTEQDYLESLQGNPRDLVVTRGVGELTALTIDFSNRLSTSQNITSVFSVVAEPALTIENITFVNKTITFDVSGGSVNSGHQINMTVGTTTPTSTVSASLYLLNI